MSKWIGIRRNICKSCDKKFVTYLLHPSHFPKMSRFFRHAGDSDSDSSSDDELSMSSGDDEKEIPLKTQTATTKPAMSRFLRTADSSSGSESESDPETDGQEGPEDGDGSSESDRPVRILSAIDKRLKEMEATGKVMDNALKINDWMAISNGRLYLPSPQPCLLNIHSE